MLYARNRRFEATKEKLQRIVRTHVEMGGGLATPLKSKGGGVVVEGGEVEAVVGHVYRDSKVSGVRGGGEVVGGIVFFPSPFT